MPAILLKVKYHPLYLYTFNLKDQFFSTDIYKAHKFNSEKDAHKFSREFGLLNIVEIYIW